MNTEDSEFERIEREIKTRALPDPIHHTDTRESLEYITGWNDCRQAMLAEQPEHHDPIGVAQDKLIAEQALAHCEAGPEYCQQCYKEAMKLALKALEPFTTPNWAGTGVDEANAAYTALQGALAKQPAPVQQEPVAWMQDRTELYVEDHPSEYFTIPLYTTPQAQRKPLTDDQIHEMANDFEEGYVFLYRSFARAIEAAHGIKEKS